MVSQRKAQTEKPHLPIPADAPSACDFSDNRHLCPGRARGRTMKVHTNDTGLLSIPQAHRTRR